MRKLIVSNNVTLDGRVDNVLDWSIPGDDEDFVKRNIDLLSQSDGLILGRKSYEFFARAREGEQLLRRRRGSEWTSSSSTRPRSRPGLQFSRTGRRGKPASRAGRCDIYEAEGTRSCAGDVVSGAPRKRPPG